MNQVVIEGTNTPSDRLSTGVRRSVTVTDEIRKLVRIGAVKVVEGSLDGPAKAEVPAPPVSDPPEPEPEAELGADTAEETGQPATDEPPARDADREDWAEWIAAKGFGATDGLDRDELIELWDARDDG